MSKLESCRMPLPAKTPRPPRLRAGVLALMLAGTGIHPALAQEYVPLDQRFTPEQRRAAGLDLLSPAQLAELDRLLKESQPALAKAAPAPIVIEDNRFAGRDEGEIRSNLVGTVSGWTPGTVFTLANGQQWQVLKGEMTLRKPVSDSAIRVVPGVAGRWFLEVVPDLPKARVQRIR